MFVAKGYCRYSGKKCRHLKVENGEGWCKKKRYRWIPKYGYERKPYIRNEKTGNPKNISPDPKVNIKAPKWCPKLKKH